MTTTTTATNKIGTMRNLLTASRSPNAASERTRVVWDKMNAAWKHLREMREAVSRAEESEAILWDEVREHHKTLYA